MNADGYGVAAWVLKHLRWDGYTYVFSDGVPFDDVCAAIQAAAIARDRTTAIAIAERYDVAKLLCIECTTRPPRWQPATLVTRPAGTTAVSERHTISVNTHVCDSCATATTLNFLRGDT